MESNRVVTRMSPGNAFGEGMLALVEPAPIERETQSLEHVDGQRALPRRGEFAGQRRGCVRRLNFDGLVDEARELARQRLEYGVDVGGRNTGREAVDQGVVRRQTARLAEQCGLVAHQMDHLFQMRRKQFEVVGLLGLDPKHFGARRRLGEPRNQRRRSGDGVVALPAHLAQIGERPILHLRGARLGALEQPRHFRRREQGVMLGLQRRQLLAAHIGTAARHHHRGIPAQQRQRAAKCVQAAKLLFQLFVRRGGHETLAAAIDLPRCCSTRSLPDPPDPRSARIGRKITLFQLVTDLSGV